MASKVKEDEKNERIIRGLLKLPANRKCINCNSVGPQYVCTNFWTFICTNCSGIHREFTHRVKSISMAKFSSQEVSSLQEGGNERAKAIYFKDWDSQRHSFPDSSNIDRLREFIKHVYEDQRFAAGRNSDRPPKRDTEDSYDKRKVDSYQGSRSPQYNDTDDRRYGEMLGSASAASNYNTSPGRFDRDDRSGHKSQNRNIADQQFPHGPKLEVRPPSQQRDVDASKSPRIQPVGVVSNFPPAPTGEGAKPSGFEFPHSSANAQNTTSLSSRGSSFGNSVELKVVSTGSLIDFDADPVSLSAGAMDHPALQKTTSLPAESGGWASFDDSFSLKVTQVTSAASTADTVMSQLSIHPTASATEYPSLSTAGISSAPNQSNARQLTTNQQHMPSLFQAPPILSSNLPFSTSSAASVGVPDNQVTPTMQGLAATLVGQSSLLVNRPLYGTNIGISPQPTSAEPIPSGRKELPADLFTMTYPSSLAPFPYYHPSQNVMGYGMQYPTVLTMPIYPPPSTPSNPFSFTDEPKLVHASTFPNLAPLQGALPNVDGHASILRTSSVPTGQWLPVPTGQWLPQQIPISTVLQSPYLVQQGAGPMPQPPPNTMYPMRQTTGGFNAGAVASNISGIDQSLASRSDRPHSPNSFTPAGNPFG